MKQIAMVPSPGMGHIIPMLEFAKKLIVLHQNRLSITLLIPGSGIHSAEQKPFLESLPGETINLVYLPKPDLEDFQGDQIGAIVFTVTRSLPYIRNAVSSLAASSNLVALVSDIFGTAAFDVAKEFNVPPYLFIPSNALLLSFYLYLPQLDLNVSCAYEDLPACTVQIPGCTPLMAEDLLEPCRDRDSFQYKWLVNEGKRFKMAEGIIVNTFEGMESGALKVLQKHEDYPPIYPVGPLVRSTDISCESSGETKPLMSEMSLEEHFQKSDAGQLSDKGDMWLHDLNNPIMNMMKWLEKQPHCSVLFVSFGSLASLSRSQIQELAFGLEMSEKSFLWVIRTPNNDNGGGDGDGDGPWSLLPDGFLDRTKGRGLVVSTWAPQARILAHGSTGGFLTHCGWNSVQESVANGVPMIAWPLQSDQKMNATLLSEELKIATRIRADDGGFVGRTEIAKAVKNLMEGEEGKELRKLTRALMEKAKMAHGGDGPSTKSLVDLVCVWVGRAKK